MKDDPNIDQKPVIMTTEKWVKVFFYVGGFLILSTNTINYWITTVRDNRDAIEYEKEANKRRLNHALEKLDYQTTIKELTKDLKACQEMK